MSKTEILAETIEEMTKCAIYFRPYYSDGSYSTKKAISMMRKDGLNIQNNRKCGEYLLYKRGISK